MEIDELLKSIRLAIQLESEAALYYKQAALKTNDELARVVLMQFSQDEEKHRRMLEYAVEKYYLQSGRFDFPEISPPVDYGKDQLSPLYSKKLAELAGEPEPVLSAVKKFAEAERKAILLYRKLADSKQEENFRKFFIALAEWEERHLAALEKQAMFFEGG
ncbi:ferritin family protein [candidate division TA06 bacterium]|uniref:Ferritin family protein n=1 Tax=candidate division TA06 bacterium TaxID=2250710 RepID=A0A933I9U7_UNCT6|nr:ferritin family protein [candidate division TA06 bacterium]